MGIRDRISFWFGTALPEVPELAEAVDLSPSGAIDADEHLYRSLTNRGTNDLPAYQHDKMLSIARHLDRTNIIGKRLLDMLRDFVAGEGVGYTTRNAAVQAVLDAHWHDPLNRWDLRGPRLFRTLLRDGEVLLTTGINTVNGMVHYGTIPATQIKGVRPDERNWEIIREIELKPQGASLEGRVLQAINLDPESGRLAGEAFFWKLNDDGLWGISLLYALADYLQIFDDLLISDAERWQLMKAFLWDVTVDGADEAKIAALTRDPSMAPPPPGSVRVHNEKVNWQAVTPDLRAADSVGAMKFLLGMILGSTGIPEHWFGFGGDVNRASATVMDVPTMKMFTYLQRLWRELLTDALAFVIDQAVAAGNLPAEVAIEDDDGNETDDLIPARQAFEVVTPELNGKDIQAGAAALSQATQSLVVAEERGYITQQTARRVYLAIARQLGVEIDPDEESDRVQAEEEAADDEPSVDDATRQAFDAARLATIASNGNQPQ